MIEKAGIACASVAIAFIFYGIGFRNGWKSFERIRRGRSIAKD